MPSLIARFSGPVDYNDDAVIRIPSGLPPFVNQTRYLLLSSEQKSPLVFLQSLDEPELCFIALPVLSIDSGYELRIEPEDLAAIHHRGASSDLLCVAIVTFSGDGPVTANLMAPVVIDTQTRLGVQAIRADGRYSHAEPLPSGAAERETPCSS
jgi:flagellar assembly factor FliW